jgi:hypothetical protein
MALLDYMAVLPTFQRRGIGGKLFEFTNNELNHLLLDNIGMLVEVPKENASELISLILYIQMCMTIERMIYLAILLLPCPMSLILKN